ncbi:hypothetical protein ACH4U6_34925 [Streptomyces netropsis]|uniref:hypothetical protein n=1 Tax=Streptomyces netropsis TaxID=55404 RepID=UPI00379D832A
MSDLDEELIGHSYTRARRHPLVIGKLPGAGRLPGGPYTITQVVTMVATFGLLVMTRQLWAHFGMGNFLVLIALPWGLAWVLRYARMDGRDPARALRSLLIYSSAPADGRLSGRPQRTARPRLASGTCTIHLRIPECAPVEQPAAVVLPAVQPVAARRRPKAGPEAAKAPVPAMASVPAPGAGAGAAPASPRTHLQALLASLDERSS